MATDWSAEQKSIYEDFESEGFEIIIRKPGVPEDFDEATMEYATGTDSVDVTTHALKKNYNISQIDGTVIKQTDIRLLFPAYGLGTIDTNNQILIGGVVQNVVNIQPVDPGNIPLLYEAQLRS